MGIVTINGQTFEVPDGANISIIGNNVNITGGRTVEFQGDLLEIKIEGQVGSVTAERGSITCQDVAGNVRAGSSVKCNSVGGGVNAGSSVECGDVTGDVDAGSSVKCGKVGGNIDAGSSVRHA